MNAEKQTHNSSQEIERLVIEVGNPEFEPGLTRLQLGADGQIQIESRLEKKENRFEYQLEEKEAGDLIARSHAPELAAKVASGRLGLPDEPRYTIEVYRGKERVQRLQVWRSDLPKLGELELVIRTLGQVVERATDGQALL